MKKNLRNALLVLLFFVVIAIPALACSQTAGPGPQDTVPTVSDKLIDQKDYDEVRVTVYITNQNGAANVARVVITQPNRKITFFDEDNKTLTGANAETCIVNGPLTYNNQQIYTAYIVLDNQGKILDKSFVKLDPK